jgi:hypothetical protein
LSKRFAPGGWTQSTKDDAITVTRRYLPFWNLELHGSINASVGLSEVSENRVCFLLFSFRFFFFYRIEILFFQLDNILFQ